MTKPAALILAAGRASRFGGALSKVLAPVEGVAMVRRVAQVVLEAGLTTYVVTGYQGDKVRAVLADLPLHFIDNPNYMQGMSTSLQAGIAAMPADIEAVMVLLADMPKVRSGLIRTMVERFGAEPEVAALVPVFAGTRGNPVILSRSLFARIMQLTGDQGARKLLEHTPAVVEFPVSDTAISLDIDTQEALASLSSGPQG